MQFNYYSDNEVLMPPIRRQIANRWMRRVCDEMNRTVGEINFQYTDDEGIPYEAVTVDSLTRLQAKPARRIDIRDEICNLTTIRTTKC